MSISCSKIDSDSKKALIIPRDVLPVVLGDSLYPQYIKELKPISSYSTSYPKEVQIKGNIYEFGTIELTPVRRFIFETPVRSIEMLSVNGFVAEFKLSFMELSGDQILNLGAKFTDLLGDPIAENSIDSTDQTRSWKIWSWKDETHGLSILAIDGLETSLVYYDIGRLESLEKNSINRQNLVELESIKSFKMKTILPNQHLDKASEDYSFSKKTYSLTLNLNSGVSNPINEFLGSKLGNFDSKNIYVNVSDSNSINKIRFKKSVYSGIYGKSFYSNLENAIYQKQVLPTPRVYVTRLRELLGREMFSFNSKESQTDIANYFWVFKDISVCLKIPEKGEALTPNGIHLEFVKNENNGSMVDVLRMVRGY